MTDKKLIGIYLPRDLIVALKKKAAEEETNVSELITRVLYTELENNEEGTNETYPR